MCGIIGVFANHSGIVDENVLTASLNTLHHRGPDYQKVWISAQKNVGLGHARLSIIDLINGNQPLSSKNKKIHVVVNGEFYDFEEKRSELEKKGHVFSTLSDSEIIIHLYEEYGVSCLQHLRGEFAFILWDEEKELCFAARDRFGIKPLFYTFYNNSLYLASEIKALLAAGVPAVWDEEAMMIFAGSTMQNSTQTLFKNITHIPPAHYLLATRGEIKTIQYWDFDYQKLDSSNKVLDAAEYISQLQTKFENAVKVRLRADVRVGCYLSGGLDSSAVLGFASKCAGKALPAFTLAFDKAEYDEKLVAQEMAQKANAEFNPILIQQDDLAAHFSDAIWHGETVFYNGHGIAKFLLSRAVRDAGLKVILTGEGADEIFAGYPHFRIDQLLYGEKETDEKQKAQILNSLRQTNLVSMGMLLPDNESHHIESVQKLLGFTPAWLLAGSQDAVRLSGLLQDNFLSKLKKIDPFQKILNEFDLVNQLQGRAPINQSLYLWSKLRLPQYLLTILGDRMEMAHSLEGRLPFLDHHVVEFMRSVPIDLKIHKMKEKFLLREAARTVITKTVYERQKHPFLAPPAMLDAKKPFAELMQTTLRGPALKALPFFDYKKIIALLDKLPSMSVRECVLWDPILMVIMSMCEMQKRFAMRA